MNSRTVHLFTLCVHAWVIAYMVALLGGDEAMWAAAPVKLFTGSHVLLVEIQALLDLPSSRHCQMICVLAGALAFFQIKHHRMWVGVLLWMLFRFIDQRTWLASNGGIQLMGNLLFWTAFLKPVHPDLPSFSLRAVPFWAIRFQLLLVYLVTGAHKLTGEAWVDGSAVLRVASDTDFHLGWLLGMPLLAKVLTYMLLFFMLSFSVAVWFKALRKWWLLAGVAFHLCTALFMDIPQMGLAFVACYAIWCDEQEAEWLWGKFRLVC